MLGKKQHRCLPAAGSARLLEIPAARRGADTQARVRRAEVGPAEAAVLAAPRSQPPNVNWDWKRWLERQQPKLDLSRLTVWRS